MAHPGQIITSGAGAPPSGQSLNTGRAFVVGEFASGTTTAAVKVVSIGQVEDAFGARSTTTDQGPYAYDALDLAFRTGLAEAYVVRSTDIDASGAVAAALGLFPASLGPGQVAAPGVTTTAAHLALTAHAAATNRTAILDASDANATTVAGLGTAARSGATNEEVAGLFAPWVTIPGQVSGTRTVPPSGAVLGLVARSDQRTSSAGSAPAGPQDIGVGVIGYSLGVSRVYTDSEWSTLDAAGVNLIIPNENGVAQLYGWNSLSTDEHWAQLNYHRLRMQIVAGSRGIMERFVFRSIDGQGHLFQEVNDALSGFLMQLFGARALFGASAADAFAVDTSYGAGKVNTPDTVSAGELRAAVEYVPSPHAKNVYTDIISVTVAEAA